ncbi:MAG TPA: hypothetical protein VHB98_02960 [Chloroflexota bacterium]|nr:hypothetical protein [Chloroflexota bacterium]
MNIPFHPDPDDVSADGMLVYVRCTDDQAVRLTRILRTCYPAVRPRLMPLFDKQQYSYCFRVPDGESALRRRWPAIQFQLLLAGGEQPARAPARPGRTPAKGPAAVDRAVDAGALERTADTPSQEAAPAGPLRAEPSLAALSAPDADAEGHVAGIGELPPPAAVNPYEPASVLREDLEPPVALEPPDPRLAHLDQLLTAGDLMAVVQQIDPDEPVPAVRGRLGIALARRGALDEARAHLLVAWQQQAANADIALELARIHWRHGDYDMAAAAYKPLLDAPPQALEPRDHAAIAELAVSGELGDLPTERQLCAIESFFAEAGAQELQAPHVESLARRGLALARQSGASDRLFHAYQHALDVALACRAGQGLRDLLEEMRHDYWQRRLSARHRFDLMDEMTAYLQDYPLLRDALIEGYEELLRQEIATARARGAFAEYARDLYRTWRKIARRGELGDEYRRLVIDLRAVEHEASADGDADIDAAPLLAGKRIALVGGHARTREHVRARLERWGVRVDEVAPPNNGRIKERDIADKIHSSDLILLIVGYMGHDMSNVVNNLVRRDVLAGTVLPVDCRGTSGICRAIARWAASA